jgi:hypothetical protein
LEKWFGGKMDDFWEVIYGLIVGGMEMPWLLMNILFL